MIVSYLNTITIVCIVLYNHVSILYEFNYTVQNIYYLFSGEAPSICDTDFVLLLGQSMLNKFRIKYQVEF